VRAGIRSIVVAAACVAALAARGDAEDAAPTITRPEAPRRAEIDAAVARGVKWLRKEQSPDGSFGSQPGETALCLLALRHGGVAADDPSCLRAAASVERDLSDDTTYGASLGVVALLAQEPRRHREKAAALVADLVRAQCVNGQWSYSTRRGARNAAGDNSNTQFATFALAAARASSLAVPQETLARCREYLRATRNADGGWGYSAKERARSYGSMTAGCAASFVFCGEAPAGSVEAGKTAEVAAAALRLGSTFSPGVNEGAAKAFGAKKGRRGDDVWRHYWLWSLERFCSVASATEIGGHDWYAEGARYLVEAQRDDGSWLGPEKAIVATPFALLFFARATLRVVTPSAETGAVLTSK
jgi:hypothetical protein